MDLPTSCVLFPPHFSFKCFWDKSLLRLCPWALPLLDICTTAERGLSVKVRMENAKGRHINGAWKRQTLSLSHPPFGCSQLTQVDGSPLPGGSQGFVFLSQVLFDRSDTKIPPRNTHHHFRAPSLNCAQDVSRACQGTLTQSPG